MKNGEIKHRRRERARESSGCACWGWGVWVNTLGARARKRSISDLSTPSISTEISLVQAIIMFPVDLAVALLVSHRLVLSPSNP